MKLRHPLAWIVALLLSSFALPAHAQKTSVMVDFTYIPLDPRGKNDRTRWPYEYAFGDWGRDRVNLVRDKGLLINHLGSRGGLGANKPLPLKGADKAVIVFIIGNGNEAAAFSFNLTDSDGTEHGFRVPIGEMDKGKLLTAVLRLDRSKDERKPGTKPGLDLQKLKSWSIGGDFGDKPIELMIQKIIAYDDRPAE